MFDSILLKLHVGHVCSLDYKESTIYFGLSLPPLGNDEH